MTTTNKTLIAIGVVAVVALVIIFAVRMHSAKQAATIQQTDEATLPTSPSDTSDAALEKDSAAIDMQLSGLDTDSEAADEGLSESQ